ncbi:uncharacterized protein LACBIDRAFT_317511 [Laccaria bicolor S238N-H82]|uniref:Predicted protein n=1 Tax=Laccaria bicolor (strain S238N-H82 / ATCC MYA-4686) TaxID=486041 RepID=B0E1W2_LACBS|nr:uncharacterized protein LACBIDRAFT_317511 [Laccaria bicolor S238N-H82]EDQ99166.1 predicted protein [Laccaria bicolor S238N-H82]|eukprot:XP_001890183.1 predicted protein [Laccaria bicolor S238N-H82]
MFYSKPGRIHSNFFGFWPTWRPTRSQLCELVLCHDPWPVRIPLHTPNVYAPA